MNFGLIKGNWFLWGKMLLIIKYVNVITLVCRGVYSFKMTLLCNVCTKGSLVRMSASPHAARQKILGIGYHMQSSAVKE